jgi:hypothetical protein
MVQLMVHPADVHNIGLVFYVSYAGNFFFYIGFFYRNQNFSSSTHFVKLVIWQLFVSRSRNIFFFAYSRDRCRSFDYPRARSHHGQITTTREIFYFHDRRPRR